MGQTGFYHKSKRTLPESFQVRLKQFSLYLDVSCGQSLAVSCMGIYLRLIYIFTLLFQRFGLDSFIFSAVDYIDSRSLGVQHSDFILASFYSVHIYSRLIILLVVEGFSLETSRVFGGTKDTYILILVVEDFSLGTSRVFGGAGIRRCLLSRNACTCVLTSA